MPDGRAPDGPSLDDVPSTSSSGRSAPERGAAGTDAPDTDPSRRQTSSTAPTVPGPSKPEAHDASILDENYARAGYHAAQTRGRRPALLLIDFAHAYYDEESPLYGGEGCRTALDNACRLAPAARAAGVPVTFTAVKYRPGGADGGAFYAKVPALACFETGRDTQRLADGLSVEADDILVEKQYPSAFFGTSLAATLHWLKVDTLLLAGVTTSGCVRASCIDSISHGFVTLVVKDAVGDRAQGPHEANLYDMSAKYADLVSTDEAIAYLREAADGTS